MLKPATREMPPRTTTTKSAEMIQSVAINSASGPRELRPNRPTVKAIAPNAPIGAARMTMLTTPKTACVNPSSMSSSGLTRGPSDASANPNSTDTKITLRMLPLANAPITELGMILRRNSVTDLRLRRAGVVGDRARVQRRGIDVEPGARLDDGAGDQAEDQRQAGRNFEVDQRLPADAADLLHALHAGDAGGNRAEDDQRDDHRDQADEGVAERPHRLAGSAARHTPTTMAMATPISTCPHRVR